MPILRVVRALSLNGRDVFGIVPGAHQTWSPRDSRRWLGWSKSEARIQDNHLRTLVGPQSPALRAAVPLCVAWPFLVSHGHVLLQ